MGDPPLPGRKRSKFHGLSHMPEWSLYMLRCQDGRLYTGITTDLERRIEEHGGDLGAKFTRGRGPFELAFNREVGDRSRASRLEWRVKRLRRSDKERLIDGALELESLLPEAQ